MTRKALFVRASTTPPPLDQVLRGLSSVYPDDEILKAEDDDGRGTGGHSRHQDDDFDEQYMRDVWALVEDHHSDWISRLLADMIDFISAGQGGDDRERISIPMNLDLGHRDRLFYRLAGHTVALLRSAGIDSPVLSSSRPVQLIAADIQRRAPWSIDLIEYSYRLGRADVSADSPWLMAKKAADEASIGAIDRHMIAHAKARAGAYFTRVAHTASDLLNQKLLEADREATTRAMLDNDVARLTPARLTTYVAELTGTKVRREYDGKMVWRGGRWSRDWRRVARTEMAFAHSYGALANTISKHPINFGKKADEPMETPNSLVFKQPQTVARNSRGQVMRPCKHCHRIWYYDDETPRLIPLKDIIKNGENVGRRAADWLATVGPTHPNDLCGPLRIFVPTMIKIYPGFAKQIEAYRGQGYDGVDR